MSVGVCDIPMAKAVPGHRATQTVREGLNGRLLLSLRRVAQGGRPCSGPKSQGLTLDRLQALAEAAVLPRARPAPCWRKRPPPAPTEMAL